MTDEQHTQLLNTIAVRGAVIRGIISMLDARDIISRKDFQAYFLHEYEHLQKSGCPESILQEFQLQVDICIGSDDTPLSLH